MELNAVDLVEGTHYNAARTRSERGAPPRGGTKAASSITVHGDGVDGWKQADDDGGRHEFKVRTS
ncbi:hypothetical protein SPI_04854 [Niveomyces insectorum RCEF 264]|uniref:Uncharacterized protein n=1 Tax=Niveomyces insectorum RCEF 264 TaxID=1081102 RepID=A0A167UX45_9HYPO|nr:hypothetical protein SPI_04854 [Niveomyces insectorum RCEF 264]